VYSPDNQDQSYLNSEALCGLVGTCNLDLESIDPTKLLNSSISLQADCTAHWCTSTNATNALDCDNYGKQKLRKSRRFTHETKVIAMTGRDVMPRILLTCQSLLRVLRALCGLQRDVLLIQAS
jgi:hypothetical protein